MIREALRFDRRSLLTTAGGFGLGMVTVGGLAAADAIVRTPTLTIIGEDDAQFALLRVRGAKIGLLFGPPTEALLVAIAPMLGWTAPALDVLAIAPTSLTEASGRWLGATQHVRSLLVLGPTGAGQMPAMRPGVRIHALTAPASMPLPHDVTVSFLPAFANASMESGSSTVGALADIRRGRQSIAMLDDLQALMRQPGLDRPPSFLVVPSGDPRSIMATSGVMCIAINSNRTLPDRLAPEGLGLSAGRLALLRTFLTEPAVVTIDEAQIRLPRWTRVPTPAATP